MPSPSSVPTSLSSIRGTHPSDLSFSSILPLFFFLSISLHHFFVSSSFTGRGEEWGAGAPVAGRWRRFFLHTLLVKTTMRKRSARRRGPWTPATWSTSALGGHTTAATTLACGGGQRWGRAHHHRLVRAAHLNSELVSEERRRVDHGTSSPAVNAWMLLSSLPQRLSINPRSVRSSSGKVRCYTAKSQRFQCSVVAGRTDALHLSSLCSTCVHRKKKRRSGRRRWKKKRGGWRKKTNMTCGPHIEVREKTKNLMAMKWF